MFQTGNMYKEPCQREILQETYYFLLAGARDAENEKWNDEPGTVHFHIPYCSQRQVFKVFWQLPKVPRRQGVGLSLRRFLMPEGTSGMLSCGSVSGESEWPLPPPLP